MYKTLRRKQGLSLFDPDYSVMKSQLDLMKGFFEPKYGTILDYGAGNSPYKSLFHFDKYVTADIEQNCDNSIDIIIDKNDVRLPVHAETVDLVLLMDVLEHVWEDKDLIDSLYSYIRPEGLLMMSLPFLYREHEYPYDYRRYTSSGILEVLRSANFSDIQILKIGNPFFVVWNLFYERNIKNFEKDRTGRLARLFWKLFNRTILPVLNVSLFKIRTSADDGVFTRMLVIAKKSRDLDDFRNNIHG